MTFTLVCDLDGTLVDSVPDLTAALNRVPALADATFDESEVAGMVGDGIAVLLQRAFAARGRVMDAASLAGFAADYADHPADVTRPYPGVVPTLQRMAAMGWRLAVCTNKPEAAARSLLASLGMTGFFAAVGGGDSFPARKPDPAHVLATLAAASGDPAWAVMIGDNVHDVTAAHGAGMKCIFASWGYGTPKMGQAAEAVARKFGEVPELVKRLLK